MTVRTRVRVVDAIERVLHPGPPPLLNDVSEHIGRLGIVLGPAGMADMVRVRLSTGKVEGFWPEELAPMADGGAP